MISVIVPVYNGEKYLPECLDSLLAQTYGDIEVIVVDDGSIDASSKIINRYARGDSRVRYLYKENGGQSSARNFGLDAAKGEYITFVDADDKLDPRFCETMLAALGDADIAICGFTHKPAGFTHVDAEVYSPAYFIEKTLYQTRFHNSACATLYRRSLFEKERFCEGLYYEDLDIFYRLVEASGKDVVWIGVPMYFYRENPTSFINSFSDKRLDALAVTEKIERHYYATPLARAARNRRFSANYNMALVCGLNRRTESSRRCWALVKEYRREVLFDRESRLKNRVGAAISYLGRNFSLLLAKIMG